MAFPLGGPAKSPLCLPVVSYQRELPPAFPYPSVSISYWVALFSSLNQTTSIESRFATKQSSRATLGQRIILLHLSRSQLNKAHHTFDKEARLWLYLKSGCRAGLWDMKKRREKTTHTLQTIRPETRKREWSARVGCDIPEVPAVNETSIFRSDS